MPWVCGESHQTLFLHDIGSGSSPLEKKMGTRLLIQTSLLSPLWVYCSLSHADHHLIGPVPILTSQSGIFIAGAGAKNPVGHRVRMPQCSIHVVLGLWAIGHHERSEIMRWQPHTVERKWLGTIRTRTHNRTHKQQWEGTDTHTYIHIPCMRTAIPARNMHKLTASETL